MDNMGAGHFQMSQVGFVDLGHVYTLRIGSENTQVCHTRQRSLPAGFYRFRYFKGGFVQMQLNGSTGLLR